MRSLATLACATALLCAIAGAHAADTAATPWPTAGWETATPEAEGVSSAALADLVDFGAANDMDSLLVVRHGKIVAEAYYAPFRAGQPHLVNSVTKAVVGTLVGVAVKEERIGRLDQPVVDLFFEREIARLDAAKKAITIETLLDSNSGLDWTEPLTDAPPETMLQMARSRDWVGFVLDRPMAQPPGRAFNYDSGTWHLLSAILTKKTGMDTLAYARQALFAPLGIGEVTWRQDPQGIRIGGFGLFMQPRDMAKIGYLYLHHGQWAGEQLLPPAWSEHVFHASVDMGFGVAPAFRYANGWWTIPDRHAYMAVGFLRQLIIVLPEVDVVAVVTGRRHYPFLPLIDRIVAAARSATPLPADDGRRARALRNACAMRRWKRRHRWPRRRRSPGRYRAGPGASSRTRPACARSGSTWPRPSRATTPRSTASAAARRAALPDRSVSMACSGSRRPARTSSPPKAAG